MPRPAAATVPSSATSPAGVILRLLEALTALLALGYLLTYLGIAVLRLRYPFELEWVEGFFLGIVGRVLRGEPLYVRPSLEFISCIYTPLYFYASAALAALLGPGFAPLRLVSLLSSLGSFVLLFAMVRRETASPFAGLVSAGLFAATFQACGAWFDLARVDSLFLFLLLAGLYVLRRSFAPERSFAGAALAGLLLGLAFLTKQTALAIAVPILLYRLFVDWRRAAVSAATLLGVVAATTLYFDWVSGGWYRFYVFQFQPQRAVVPARVLGFWTQDLLGTLPIATLGALLYAATRLRRWRDPDALFYPVAAAAMVGASWFARMQAGGYHNNFLPAFAAVALLLGLGLAGLRRWLADARDRGRTTLGGLALLACALQLGFLAYDPRPQIPTDEDRAAGQDLVRLLESAPGEVFVANQGYLARAAGKRSFAHGVMLWDIFRSDREELKSEILEQLNRRLRARPFAAVIESDGWPTFPEVFERHYVLERRLFGGSDAFWPVTGAPPVRPEFLLVPRPPPAVPPVP